MRKIAVTLVLCLLVSALSVPGSAYSADLSRMLPIVRTERVVTLPFPRSERSQAVWDAGACWSECGAQCTWRQNGCLQVDTQGQCLSYTDSCDRYCQRTCRTSSGPFLNLAN